MTAQQEWKPLSVRERDTGRTPPSQAIVDRWDATHRACEECGATDTELTGITPWDAIPAGARVYDGPLDWFCVDIMACYARVEEQCGGSLPL
jgi:hypothetical protein